MKEISQPINSIKIITDHENLQNINSQQSINLNMALRI